MLCKGCGHDRRLIKAHVFPKGYYDAVKRGEKTTFVTSATNPGEYSNWQNGMYDAEMLCSECDGRIGILDKMSYRHFRDKPSSEEIKGDRGEILGYKIESSECDGIVAWFLTLLWRAHHTKLEFFKPIELGPWSERFRRQIFEGDRSFKESVSVILLTYFDRPFEGLVPEPLKDRILGVNCYRVFLPYYTAIVRVDQRRFAAPFDSLELDSKRLSGVYSLSFKGTYESKFLFDIARSFNEHRKRKKNL